MVVHIFECGHSNLRGEELSIADFTVVIKNSYFKLGRTLQARDQITVITFLVDKLRNLNFHSTEISKIN